MRLIKSILIILSLLYTVAFSQADTVRVATYNVLNFPGNDYPTRLPYFHIVMHSMKPDILIVQEVQSQSGVNMFLSQALDGNYSAAPFHDGPDTDNSLFFRSSKFRFVGANYIATSLRDIAEYILTHNVSNELLHIFSVHLKASSGSSNEQQRLQEATLLKNYINNLPPQANVIVVGDYNLYSAGEPAFATLVTDGPVIDPLNAAGDWHNNSQFAYLHTQSPRVEQFGGGSTGGMDDRFDLILISDDLTDNFIHSSYTAFGNDGRHFNESINSGTNYSVPDSVADALYYASDHLPVYCEFQFSPLTAVKGNHEPLLQNPRLLQNYPNPFNPSTTVEYFLAQATNVDLSVYNVRGQKVATLVSGPIPAGLHRFKWVASDRLTSGIFFLKLRTAGFQQIRKVVLLR